MGSIITMDAIGIQKGIANLIHIKKAHKVVLALLEKEKTFKKGIRLKCQKAALSTRYLRKVLGL